MVKIMYEFLRWLQRIMTNIGEDQGIFLVFWEVYILEKKTSRTQYGILCWWLCSPKLFWQYKKNCMSSHLYLFSWNCDALARPSLNCLSDKWSNFKNTTQSITNPKMETLKHKCYCVCQIVLLNIFLFTNTLGLILVKFCLICPITCYCANC